MKTILASAIALSLFAGVAAARSPQDIFTDIDRVSPRSIFDQIQDSAPRSPFDQLQDAAPRTYFDDLQDAAPRSSVFTTLQRNAP